MSKQDTVQLVAAALPILNEALEVSLSVLTAVRSDEPEDRDAALAKLKSTVDANQAKIDNLKAVLDADRPAS